MLIYEKFFKVEKSFVNQLNSLYGISYYRANTICSLLGLKKYNNLNNISAYIKTELFMLIKNIIEKDKNYFIENSLKHYNTLKRKELKVLNNYKSIRFNQNLPANGQRTHTNAKTQKKTRK